MKKKKKSNVPNLLAALSALACFVIAIIIIIYFMSEKTSTGKTITLFILFGICAISFIINTVLFFLGTPNLKNK